MVERSAVFFEAIATIIKNVAIITDRTVVASVESIFFIPIFPYENKHLLICPVCTYGAKIERKEVENLKQLANFNSDLINGRITDQEHKQKVRATLENKQLIDTSLSNSNTRPTNQSSKALHCKYCAYKNVSKAGFCRNCGKKLNNN